MKLYPPYLERTIPAFYTDSEGTVLTVPFSMNRAVNLEDVSGFQLKIKTVQTSGTEGMGSLTFIGSPIYDSVNKNYYVKFNVTNNFLDPTITTQKEKFIVGNFYKIQMAYIDNNNNIGYFSTVSIVKYTTKPEVYIQNLEENIENSNVYTYKGTYSQKNRDVSEKAYQYRFILIDYYNNIIDDTGLLLCDNTNNQETYSCDFYYEYMNDIPDGYIQNTSTKKFYMLQLTIYTNNGLVISSPFYKLVKQDTQPPSYETPIIPILDFNNGYITIQIQGPIDSSTGNELKLIKEYLICRSVEDSDYAEWHQLFKVFLNNQELSKQVLRDFTVEQGKTYIYSLQEKMPDGTYSSRIYSAPIYTDFEDTFIYDGAKQLKLRYNPKVGAFKIDKQESKIDTIGSKFPFIFENNHIKYKEISIGGLISYLSDEEELFMTNNELQIENSSNAQVVQYQYETIKNMSPTEKLSYLSAANLTDTIRFTEPLEGEKRQRTIALTGYSIGAERIFKNKVVQWLQNGQVKLFKSPTEGNFLIYITNVSLTPEDRIGRTIHQLQATAYEISEFSYKDLIIYNIYQNINIPQWISLPLSSSVQPIDYLQNGIDDNRYEKEGRLWYLRGSIIPDGMTVLSVRFDGVTAGAKFTLGFKNQSAQTILIGSTGNYILDFGQEITAINIPNDAYYDGIITYTYNKE